ncbi:MAG: FxsA family protein [Actinomycetia bacterium]|nr:FxsA family protein [Actinomycetes bacterium]
MRIRTWLFLAFVFVPIAEIALFIYVGSVIGIGPTLVIVIATAFAGSWLVTRQGRQTWVRIRDEIVMGQQPTAQLVHGAMILVAGALLLTPGFLTDVAGFLLLVPAVREGLRGWFVARLASRWVVVR